MRVTCPIEGYEDTWVELPDEWLVYHSHRYTEALQKAEEQDHRGQWRQLALALSLLENWNIPGLNGPPDKWDLSRLPLRLAAWVTTVTIPSFWACFEVPKASSLPSSNGEMERDGELETTA